jgi:hypothetical protein
VARKNMNHVASLAYQCERTQKKYKEDCFGHCQSMFSIS